MSGDLKKAKDLLAARKPEEALGPLLAAWRACPDASLGELIDRVSAQVSRPELTGSAKQRHEQFTAIWKKKDPADIGRLYACLGEGQIAHFVAQLDMLEELPADPRFTARALQLLQKPSATSSSSFPAWRRLFNQLARNQDLRAVPALKALDFLAILGANQEYSARFFEEKNAKTIAALEKVKASALQASDVAIVKELLGAQQASTRDTTSLEAAVYAAPSDDAPRMVLADALLEKGDPRGEFISLQLEASRRRLTAAERWREYDLLEAHRDAWLGPLTLALDEWNEIVEFRRGFVDTLAIASDKPHTHKVISESPQFKTVRTLLLRLYDESPLPLELLRSPACANIIGLGELNARAFHELLTSETPWPYERLYCNEPDYDAPARDVKALCDSKAIPKVRSLRVSGYSIKPVQFAPIWKSELGARLTEFGASHGVYRIADWVKEIEAHGLDERLTSFDLSFNFGSRDFVALLTRGDDGRLSHLEVWKRPPNPSYGSPKLSELCKRLDALPPDRLTGFRYAGKLSKGDRKTLETTLSRQKKLATSDLR